MLANQLANTGNSWLGQFNRFAANPFGMPELGFFSFAQLSASVNSSALTIQPRAFTLPYTNNGLAYIGGSDHNTTPDGLAGSLQTAASSTTSSASWATTNPSNVFGTATVLQLEYVGSKIVALLSDGSLWNSTNGISWSKVFDPAAHAFNYSYDPVPGCRDDPFHNPHSAILTPVITRISGANNSLIYASVNGAAICLNDPNVRNYFSNGIYVSGDGGASFQQVFSPTFDGTYENYVNVMVLQQDFEQVSFSKSGIYYRTSGACGFCGVYRKLFKLGSNKVLAYSDASPGSIGFGLYETNPSPASGTYLSYGPTLERLNGSTMTSLNTGAGGGIYGVSEAPDGTIWAAGGSLKKSSDGGQTWQTVNVIFANGGGSLTSGIYTVVTGSDNTVWLGTQDGFVVSGVKGSDSSYTWYDQRGNLSESVKMVV